MVVRFVDHAHRKRVNCTTMKRIGMYWARKKEKIKGMNGQQSEQQTDI